MELKGERRLPVDRDTAWRALNDPEVLRACIPGCESVEKTGEGAYAVGVAVALGPVRARFKGTLRLEDVVPPSSYTLRFDGQGGTAGFAKGSSQVSLAEDGAAATILRYTANAQVGGRLAQVGSRLIDASALKLADDFFAAFERQVAGTIPPSAPAPGPGRSPSAPVARRIAYIAIVVAVVVLGIVLLR